MCSSFATSKKNKVLFSCRLTASLRAAEAARPDALFRDDLAGSLAGNASGTHTHFIFRSNQNDREAALRKSAEEKKERDEMPFIAVRTRCVDDALRSCISSFTDRPESRNHDHGYCVTCASTEAPFLTGPRSRTGIYSGNNGAPSLRPQVAASPPASPAEDQTIRTLQCSSSAPVQVQVVFLGAGLDTRAYRLDTLANCAVFEVDHPDVFSYKEGVLSMLPSPPTLLCASLVRVSGDITEETEPSAFASRTTTSTVRHGTVATNVPHRTKAPLVPLLLRCHCFSPPTTAMSSRSSPSAFRDVGVTARCDCNCAGESTIGAEAGDVARCPCEAERDADARKRADSGSAEDCPPRSGHSNGGGDTGKHALDTEAQLEEGDRTIRPDLPSWLSNLVAAGFSVSTATVWVLEGVLMYFHPRQVATLLRTLANTSSGMPHSALIADTVNRPAAHSRLKYFRLFHWGCDADGMPQFLAQHGWHTQTVTEIGRDGQHFGRYARGPIIDSTTAPSKPPSALRTHFCIATLCK